MTDVPNESLTNPAAAERRARPRLRPSCVVAINLADQNGGVACDISEDGLAVAAAMPLHDVDLPSIQIRLPGSKNKIEARGQIVWKSESKRRAGVRFVNLTEGARQRIRSWIASETSGQPFSIEEKETPLPEKPLAETAELRAPTSAIPEDNSVIASERPAHDGDRSGAPPVASGDIEEAVSKPGQQDSWGTASGQDDWEGSYQGPERRRHKRRKIPSCAYAEWDGKNGGMAHNLGEGGLALTSASALAAYEHRSVRLLRLQFPDTNDRIEVCGEIAWKANSEKRAGVRFLGLTEDARRRIRDWVSGTIISEQVQAPEERAEQKRARHAPAKLISIPAITARAPRAPSQALQPPRTDAATSGRPSAPEVVASKVSPIPVRQESANPPSSGHRSAPGAVASKLIPISRASHPEHISAERSVAKRKLPVTARQLERVAAVIGLVAVLSFAFGWAKERFPVWNAALVHFTQTGTLSSHFTKPTAILDTHERAIVPTVETASVYQSSPEKDQRLESDLPLAPKQSILLENPLPYAPMQQSSIAVLDEARRSREGEEFGRAQSGSRARAEATNGTLSAAVGFAPATAKLGKQEPPRFLPGAQPHIEPEMPPVPSSGLMLPNDSLLLSSEMKRSSPLPPKREIPVSFTGSVAIVADRYPSIRTPLERRSKKSGESLQLGHLVSRIEPVYPSEAKEQGVEGAVEMHAIIGRDGSVENVLPVNGPALLVPAAVNAVRQWRYTETLVAGRPVQTEQDISVKFRLAKSGTPE